MMDLPLIGTVGLLIIAKKRGLINAVKPLLNEMTGKGIRYGERFCEKVLKEVGES